MSQNKSDEQNDQDIDARGQEEEYKCKCAKNYREQGSQHNHIRIKHDDNKKDFEIIRKPKNLGRPATLDEQKKNSKQDQHQIFKQTKKKIMIS
ncbi:hypothetical protein ABPG72_004238 [Tetrahymena utriculariae]